MLPGRLARCCLAKHIEFQESKCTAASKGDQNCVLALPALALFLSLTQLDCKLFVGVSGMKSITEKNRIIKTGICSCESELGNCTSKMKEILDTRHVSY